MNPRWVTVDELAVALHLSVQSLRRAYRRGELPIIRIGRLVRFDVEDVRKSMEGDQHCTVRRQIVAALEQRTAGGASRRRAQSPRPRTGNTGALPTRLITGGLESR